MRILAVIVTVLWVEGNTHKIHCLSVSCAHHVGSLLLSHETSRSLCLNQAEYDNLILFCLHSIGRHEGDRIPAPVRVCDVKRTDLLLDLRELESVPRHYSN